MTIRSSYIGVMFVVNAAGAPTADLWASLHPASGVHHTYPQCAAEPQQQHTQAAADIPAPHLLWIVSAHATKFLLYSLATRITEKGGTP